MIEDFRREFESTMIPLLRGIVDDTQKLLRQEIALARVEVTEDALRARDAVVGISVGALMGYMAFIFVCFAAVYLLVAYQPGLPVWGAYGIVAVILAVMSWIFTSRGVRRAREIRGIPEQTVDSIQQGFQWMQRRA
ncbi:MAG: hypothetical protein RIS36_187 [Pseudomonadota bacterium]|jgi:uncharacterized membrane protein (DUF485 family)